MKINVWHHLSAKCPNCGPTLPSFLHSQQNFSFIPSEVLKDSLVFQSQILHPQIPHFEQSVSGVIYRSLSSEQLSQISGMHLIWFVKITKRNVGEDEAQSQELNPIKVPLQTAVTHRRHLHALSHSPNLTAPASAWLTLGLDPGTDTLRKA